VDPITLGLIGLGGSSTFAYTKKNGSWRAYFKGKPWGGVHKKKSSRLLGGRAWDAMPVSMTDE